MSYYDVDELLAADERVRCVFLTDAADCAFLDASCVGADLREGAAVELPLWLARPLAEHEDVGVEVPAFLSQRFRRMLRAGPASVNLREFSAFLFQVGRDVLPLVPPQAGAEIDEILRLAYGGERYRELVNNSMSALQEDTTEFTRKLTEDEKKLFDAGMSDSRDFVRWKGRHAETISAAAVVERSLKKRKFGM